MQKPTFKCKKAAGGFRASISLGNDGVSVKATTKTAAVCGALERAKEMGLITQAEREHFLIHGRFEARG